MTKDLPANRVWASPEEKAYWMGKGSVTALFVVGRVNALDRSKPGWQEELTEATALHLRRQFLPLLTKGR